MENRLNKIVYILGAGASANAIPVVRSIDKSLNYTGALREMAQNLRVDKTINPSYKILCQELCDNLEWLADKGDEYSTIDTFAKFILKKKKPDYDAFNRLKFTLSLYFTIKQFIEKKIDTRYKIFLTTLIDDDQKALPDNIKILNWNYDFQMQIAGQNFREETFEYLFGSDQHGAGAVPYYPPLGNEMHHNHAMENIFGGLSMVHLNGIAGSYYYNPKAHIQNYFKNHYLETIDDLFEQVQIERKYKNTLLTFAFEKEGEALQHTRQRLNYAKQMIQDADYLVVIGYSFPDDNYDIDKQILSAIKADRLKKIFFQDPYIDSGDFIKRRFNIDTPIDKVSTFNNNFYIPDEVRHFRV